MLSQENALRPVGIQSEAKYLFLSVIIVSLLSIPFFDGLVHMVNGWQKEEYSHGYFLPIIAIYILWQRWGFLRQLPHNRSYFGVFLVFVGLALSIVGDIGTLYTVIQYGYVLSIMGLVLSVTGLPTFRHYFFPLLILVFMIPLPGFIYNSLSSKLQLISSEIGVSVIELFDIPVYLEGNVIDLGEIKLQVVEACSGLRYLFPLSALAYILALMLQASVITKIVIFISSIPVTIFMNSFRIGLIGVTVDVWGKQAAEGVLHDFEGWVVFMSSLLVLILEIKILALLSGEKRPLAELLSFDANTHRANYPVQSEVATESKEGSVHLRLGPLYLGLALIVASILGTYFMPERETNIPERDVFAAFPESVGAWQGQRDYLNPQHLKALKLTDYLMMNYAESPGYPVNYYVAYYDSQQKGRSAHSPKSCIPGDGWEIKEFSRQMMNVSDYLTLPVNRVLIGKGQQTTLVYYWFQQRGRLLNNEYLVKFYLLWDSITQGRTDGAMIRVTTPVFEHEPVEQADARIHDLISESHHLLQSYVPE